MMINAKYGFIILRITLAVVFLWFGVQQLYVPTEWAGFVPEFLGKVMSPAIFVLLNGVVEVLFGMLLLSGFYVRFVSFILAIHLFGIAISMGYTPIMVRDVGLSLATLAVFFFGADEWCLDVKYPR